LGEYRTNEECTKRDQSEWLARQKILIHPAKLICLPDSADSFFEKEPEECRSPGIREWR
jgi:hypothetical protein